MSLEKITCSKLYTGYPFSHRQPRHDGHCSLIHGHNWDFEFEFACSEMDENGFVIDFGKLKFIRVMLDDKFDHTFVVPEYDPEMKRWEQLAKDGLIKLTVIPDASAEGLAKYLHDFVSEMVKSDSNGRVWVSKVTVWEDSHDKAVYQNDNH